MTVIQLPVNVCVLQTRLVSNARNVFAVLLITQLERAAHVASVICRAPLRAAIVILFLANASVNKGIKGLTVTTASSATTKTILLVAVLPVIVTLAALGQKT